jgi:hypothetical protein
MYHLALKCYKSRLLRCILRIQYPRVLLFFTLSATANTVHVLILRACKCILSEHASCRDVDLNPGSSLTSGVRTLTRTYGEYRTCYVYSTFSRGVSQPRPRRLKPLSAESDSCPSSWILKRPTRSSRTRGQPPHLLSPRLTLKTH